MQAAPGATSVAILAGGQARRLGGSKHARELGGRPMIAFPVAAALATGLDTFVVAKPDTDLPKLECPVQLEPASPRHPLLGVITALDRTGEGAIVVVGCDMPFANPDAIRWLAEQPEPLVVPRVGSRAHPLLARYDSSLRTRLGVLLEAGESVRAAVGSLEPRYVEGAELGALGDPDRLLFNVNTEADLEQAQLMLDTASA